MLGAGASVSAVSECYSGVRRVVIMVEGDIYAFSGDFFHRIRVTPHDQGGVYELGGDGEVLFHGAAVVCV